MSKVLFVASVFLCLCSCMSLEKARVHQVEQDSKARKDCAAKIKSLMRPTGPLKGSKVKNRSWGRVVQYQIDDGRVIECTWKGHARIEEVKFGVSK